MAADPPAGKLAAAIRCFQPMATKKHRRLIPPSPAAWLEEIALAYDDARQVIPFARLIGDRVDSTDLFHVAPVVAIKFRGLGRTRTEYARRPRPRCRATSRRSRRLLN